MSPLTTFILKYNKIQNADILVPANPDPSEKWPLKRRERVNMTSMSAASDVLSYYDLNDLR